MLQEPENLYLFAPIQRNHGTAAALIRAANTLQTDVVNYFLQKEKPGDRSRILSTNNYEVFKQAGSKSQIGADKYPFYINILSHLPPIDRAAVIEDLDRNHGLLRFYESKKLMRDSQKIYLARLASPTYSTPAFDILRDHLSKTAFYILGIACVAVPYLWFAKVGATASSLTLATIALVTTAWSFHNINNSLIDKLDISLRDGLVNIYLNGGLSSFVSKLLGKTADVQQIGLAH